MDNKNLDNKISPGGEFSVDDILAEFSPSLANTPNPFHKEPPNSEPKVKGHTDYKHEKTANSDFEATHNRDIDSEVIGSAGDAHDDYGQPSKRHGIFNFRGRNHDGRDNYNDYESSKPNEAVPLKEDTVVKRSGAGSSDLWLEGAEASDANQNYAPRREYSKDGDENEHADEAASNQSSKTPDWRQAIAMPVISALQDFNSRRAERQRATKEKAKLEAENLPPELEPKKAAMLYAQQADAMRMRCYISSFLCVFLLWLSLGLPLPGALGDSMLIRSLVCLIFLLCIMLTGLDILTNGIISITTGKAGAESLIAVSCIVALIDTIFIYTTNTFDFGLPFCGVSALSLVFAMWASYLNCKSFAISFQVASKAKNPSVILATETRTEEGRVLIKSTQPVTGFVRTSEQADLLESVYMVVSPILLIFSLILSIFSTIVNNNLLSFIHTFSACTAISASLSAIFGFAFPYYVLTRRLATSGVSIAGSAGASELTRISRVVIRDTDIFPLRTVSISDMTIAEGMSSAKVIAATSSMIISAGFGIAPVFDEFMKKNYCNLQEVEDFICHEGGGLVGRINHEQIHVGTSSFMQLMGIYIPRGIASKNAMYTAINSEYAAAYEMNYTPVKTVQHAISSLLENKIQPVFGVKDFNITPMLIKQKFSLPKNDYIYPSYANRYKISSVENHDNPVVTSMFSRGGLKAVVGLRSRAKTFYNSLRVCTAISVTGSFIGILLMTYLCSTSSWTSASCSNMLSFMLLWLIPVFITSFSLRN